MFEIKLKQMRGFVLFSILLFAFGIETATSLLFQAQKSKWVSDQVSSEITDWLSGHSPLIHTSSRWVVSLTESTSGVRMVKIEQAGSRDFVEASLEDLFSRVSRYVSGYVFGQLVLSDRSQRFQLNWGESQAHPFSSVAETTIPRSNLSLKQAKVHWPLSPLSAVLFLALIGQGVLIWRKQKRGKEIEPFVEVGGNDGNTLSGTERASALVTVSLVDRLQSRFQEVTSSLILNLVGLSDFKSLNLHIVLGFQQLKESVEFRKNTEDVHRRLLDQIHEVDLGQISRRAKSILDADRFFRICILFRALKAEGLVQPQSISLSYRPFSISFFVPLTGMDEKSSQEFGEFVSSKQIGCVDSGHWAFDIHFNQARYSVLDRKIQALMEKQLQ